MTTYISREEFFDNDDTKKWDGEAERQLRIYPPGTSIELGFKKFFINFLKDKDRKSFKTAIDFGCGTGLFRDCFEGMEYTGVDQNPDMLAGLKKRHPDVESFSTPLNTMSSVINKQFDVGLFCTVLQHNHQENSEEILTEASKLIRPGGYLFLFEATYIDRHYPDYIRKKYKLPDINPESLESPDGHTLFTEKGWRHLLSNHGFEVLEYDGDCGYIAQRVSKNGLRFL